MRSPCPARPIRQTGVPRGSISHVAKARGFWYWGLEGENGSPRCIVADVGFQIFGFRVHGLGFRFEVFEEGKSRVEEW